MSLDSRLSGHLSPAGFRKPLHFQKQIAMWLDKVLFPKHKPKSSLASSSLDPRLPWHKKQLDTSSLGVLPFATSIIITDIGRQICVSRKLHAIHTRQPSWISADCLPLAALYMALNAVLKDPRLSGIAFLGSTAAGRRWETQIPHVEALPERDHNAALFSG